MHQHQNEAQTPFIEHAIGLAFKDKATAERLTKFEGIEHTATQDTNADAIRYCIGAIQGHLTSAEYNLTHNVFKAYLEKRWLEGDTAMYPERIAAMMAVYGRCLMTARKPSEADSIFEKLEMIKAKKLREQRAHELGKQLSSGTLSEAAAKREAAELRASMGKAEPPKPKGKAVLTLASSVQERAIEWLWDRYIPLGAVSLVAGRQGEGKSTVVSDLVARISNGLPMPDGSKARHGGVVWMTAEESASVDIIPRLKTHGADLSRIAILEGKATAEGTKGISLADADVIEDAILKTPDCRLLIVDPLGGFIGGQVDINADNQVRDSLKPLGRLAEKYKVAVVIICHLNKDESRKVAVNMINGSTGISGYARAAYMVLRDPRDRAKRYFSECKRNNGKHTATLPFEIVSGESRLDSEGNEISTAKVQWAAESIDKVADELLSEWQGTIGKSKSEAAQALISDLLSTGAKESEVIFAEGQRLGISKDTIYRAKEALGVKAKPGTKGGRWLWELPEAEPTATDDDPWASDSKAF